MKQQISIKQAVVIGNTITLECSPADCNKVRAVIVENKPLAAVIGTATQKRSLSANAYAWLLMGQLAAKLNKPVLEIYRETIRDIGGSSAIISIRADAAKAFKTGWESKGEGWQVHKMDEMATPQGAFYNLQCWYGSSVFDSVQMHHLIDLIVQECQQQGIPTMTPEEIAKLKGLTDDAPTDTQ
nr:MAG TPA: NinB protein [Caudoviricetes sp.]